MKLSELIAEAKMLMETYGDHKIIGGYVLDDTTPKQIIPLDKEGCETRKAADTVGYFIE